ncbi:hypothetical protein COCON_G00087400 [Conger conger]|uniref:Uncharacterized protein n=1 Tax=Conger conger TaxID=82655 RepID=A0A9Q1I0K5_CONCO|nr:hypothetical protein COCON_G00087400 [Conger conger]
MVNGWHLYSAFIQSAVQLMLSPSPIHTHTHTPAAIGCHARCLAQGHFDTAQAGDGTGNPPTARQLLLRPEPCLPPYIWVICSTPPHTDLQVDVCSTPPHTDLQA